MLAIIAPAADAGTADGSPNMLQLAMPIFVPVASADYWQVVIEQQIIIRVPARRTSINNFNSTARTIAPRMSNIVWKEKKGPKCINMRDIAMMQTAQRDSIDLITQKNQRFRAKLSRGCQSVDFYAGFYMAENKDGRLCEGRDQLQARTGAKCEVADFRLMVPQRREK